MTTVAGAPASASKYVLAWQGRHIFNPAAVGATALTIISIWAPDLGSAAWWVGNPLLALPVLLLGLVVLVRTEKVRVIGLFLIIAVAVALLRTIVQAQSAGFALDPGMTFSAIVLSSPFLFLGAFMLSEPLTLPPRRWQQLVVAAVVGVLAGWPISLGEITLGQERALLVGNLVAFVFAMRTAVRRSPAGSKGEPAISRVTTGAPARAAGGARPGRTVATMVSTARMRTTVRLDRRPAPSDLLIPALPRDRSASPACRCPQAGRTRSTVAS